MKNRLAATILLALGSFGFSHSQAPVTPRLEFEVASIKPHPDPTGPSRIVCHGKDATMPPNSTPALGRCVVDRRPLTGIIEWAYGVQFPLITGGPLWVTTETFDIQAKAEDPDSTTREKFQLMLQSLLESRFKLKFHREPGEGPGYELSISKKGSRLQNAEGVRAPQGIFLSAPEGHRRFTGNAAGMWRLTAGLSLILGVPVIDKTGLPGVYDFYLDWTDRTSDLSAPPLPNALEEQLGLKLESKKVPYQMFVIDHAEKPTPN